MKLKLFDPDKRPVAAAALVFSVTAFFVGFIAMAVSVLKLVSEFAPPGFGWFLLGAFLGWAITHSFMALRDEARG